MLTSSHFPVIAVPKRTRHSMAVPTCAHSHTGRKFEQYQTHNRADPPDPVVSPKEGDNLVLGWRSCSLIP